MFYQIQQSQYPDYLTAPMAAELTEAGFESLKTAESVENVLKNEQGTVLVVVNSVCGCAARNARPAAIAATREGKLPSKMVTVFAGVDGAAVQKARDFCLPYPPSSPAMRSMLSSTCAIFFMIFFSPKWRTSRTRSRHWNAYAINYSVWNVAWRAKRATCAAPPMPAFCEA